MPADTSAAALTRRQELSLLAALTAVHFAHIVDFMILMPLGPQLMRLWGIGPDAFGLLVSSYTFAAAASGVAAMFVVDRIDRKHALLGLTGGFVLATVLCGLATGYETLLAARLLAGAFGGVMGAIVLAIVADVVPYARRARANALVASAFSLSAVLGVPAGLWLAAAGGWRTPFLALAAFTVVVALVATRLLPPLAAHVNAGRARSPLAQLRAVVGVANHWRAFSFILALMMAGFTVIPFIAAYLVANVAVHEDELALVYMAGGVATLVTAQVIGRLADRYGKKRVFTIVALASTGPILLVTHLPALPLGAVLAVSTLFFVLVPGRFGPAMALVSGSAEPRVRGSFMSLNAAMMQMGSGIAASVSGAVVSRSRDGTLAGFGHIGWIAVGFTLLAIVLAWRVRVVDRRVPDLAGAGKVPE